MSTPDTGPTRGDKRRVRVPFQPRDRNVTPREYEALKRSGYLVIDLPPQSEGTPVSQRARVPSTPEDPTAPPTKRTTRPKTTTEGA